MFLTFSVAVVGGILVAFGMGGVGAAVEDRDAPFGDYSQAPHEGKPNPENVIDPGA